jgi:hypothetical protein
MFHLLASPSHVEPVAVSFFVHSGVYCLRHSVEPVVSAPLLPVAPVGNHLVSSLILKSRTV